MKRKVITFWIVFILVIIALTLIRIFFIGGTTGNVIKQEYNPIFDWRGFGIKIVEVNDKVGYLEVKYSLKEFSGINHEVNVNVNLLNNGQVISSASSVVALPGLSEIFYYVKIGVPSGMDGQASLDILGNDGKITSEDFIDVNIKGNVNDNKPQTDSNLDKLNNFDNLGIDNYWVGLMALIFITGFLIFRRARAYGSKINEFRQRHHQGKIHIDTHHRNAWDN